METAFSRMPIKEFYDRVIAGLSDDNDIRGVCNLMITKLITLSPDETLARLDVIAECYRKTLQTKLKEHAVKQDLEKQEEASKGVLRVTLLVTDRLAAMHPSSTLAAAAGGGGGGGGSHSNALREWENFWDWVSKDHDTQIKKLREESRSLQTASM
jgi:cullin-associated NEDD8-dissociated protein 1